MTKTRIGLVLFWMGLAWAFFWGIVASLHQAGVLRGVLTFEELNQTVWAVTGPLSAVWGYGPPLGALMAGTGLLLHSGGGWSTAWKAGMGVLLGLIASFVVGAQGHFPPLYAIGGTLILSFFFGVVWFWGKERRVLQGRSGTAADLRLVGYVFMLVGMWFTCGIAGREWFQALAEHPPLLEPITVMMLFVMGWLFLFLGEYSLRQPQRPEST